MEFDESELEMIYKALGAYYDTVDPKRDAYRWKILQVKHTIFELQKIAQRENRG